MKMFLKTSSKVSKTTKSQMASSVLRIFFVINSLTLYSCSSKSIKELTGEKLLNLKCGDCNEMKKKFIQHYGIKPKDNISIKGEYICINNSIINYNEFWMKLSSSEFLSKQALLLQALKLKTLMIQEVCKENKQKSIMPVFNLIKKAGSLVDPEFYSKVTLNPIIANQKIPKYKLENTMNLYNATINLNCKEIENLLKNTDANPNYYLDEFAISCWDLAISSGNIEMVKIYLESYKTMTNTLDSSGNSALHTSIFNKNYKLAKLLILYDFDVNLKDGRGTTPLSVAYRWNNFESYKLLLKNGALPFEEVSDDKKSLLEYLVDAKRIITRQIKKNENNVKKNVFTEEIKEKLLKNIKYSSDSKKTENVGYQKYRDYFTKMRLKNGKSQLFFAIDKGVSATQNILYLDENLIDEPDDDGVLPLIYAIASGKFNQALLILNKKKTNFKKKNYIHKEKSMDDLLISKRINALSLKKINVVKEIAYRKALIKEEVKFYKTDKSGNSFFCPNYTKYENMYFKAAYLNSEIYYLQMLNESMVLKLRNDNKNFILGWEIFFHRFHKNVRGHEKIIKELTNSFETIADIIGIDKLIHIYSYLSRFYDSMAYYYKNSPYRSGVLFYTYIKETIKYQLINVEMKKMLKENLLKVAKTKSYIYDLEIADIYLEISDIYLLINEKNTVETYRDISLKVFNEFKKNIENLKIKLSPQEKRNKLELEIKFCIYNEIFQKIRG